MKQKIFGASRRRELSARRPKEVVDYFNEGIPENPNIPTEKIARQFKPLNLTVAWVMAISDVPNSGALADFMLWNNQVLRG